MWRKAFGAIFSVIGSMAGTAGYHSLAAKLITNIGLLIGVSHRLVLCKFETLAVIVLPLWNSATIPIFYFEIPSTSRRRNRKTPWSRLLFKALWRGFFFLCYGQSRSAHTARTRGGTTWIWETDGWWTHTKRGTRSIRRHEKGGD